MWPLFSTPSIARFLPVTIRQSNGRNYQQICYALNHGHRIVFIFCATNTEIKPVTAMCKLRYQSLAARWNRFPHCSTHYRWSSTCGAEIMSVYMVTEGTTGFQKRSLIPDWDQLTGMNMCVLIVTSNFLDNIANRKLVFYLEHWLILRAMLPNVLNIVWFWQLTIANISLSRRKYHREMSFSVTYSELSLVDHISGYDIHFIFSNILTFNNSDCEPYI